MFENNGGGDTTTQGFFFRFRKGGEQLVMMLQHLIMVNVYSKVWLNCVQTYLQMEEESKPDFE